MKMKCPECSKAMKRAESRTERVEYDGEAVMVDGLAGWFCTACGEAILDDESARRCGEAGETQAPMPLVKLLRLVNQHPELMGEIGSL